MSRSKEYLDELLSVLTREDLIGLVNFHHEEVVRQEKAEYGRRMFLSGYRHCKMQNYQVAVLLNSCLFPDLNPIQLSWFDLVDKAFPVYLKHMYEEREDAK